MNRNTIFSKFFCCLILFNVLIIKTLQAQVSYQKIERVVLSKGHFDAYQWNEFVLYCEAVSMRSGIPIPVLIGIAIHESAYFGSDLAQNASNYFGITAFRDWSNRPVYRMGHATKNPDTGRYENKSTPFRLYQNTGESVYDFAKFITNWRYAKARQCGDDVQCWLEKLHEGGYAQNEDWAVKIFEMLQRYEVLGMRD